MSSKTTPSFPVKELFPKLEIALKKHSSIVVTAPPGAGKSTVLPLFLLETIFSSDSRQILVFEPRRISAKSLATYLCKITQTRLGETIGYQVRSDNRSSSSTRLKYITEGVFSRLLLKDPYLENYCAIVLDEFHERSQHIDVALAQIQEIQNSVRPDLKLIVMSATINPDPLLNYLANAVHLHSEGRHFPVNIEYLSRPILRHDESALFATALEKIQTILKNHPQDNRDILCFLPGVAEIDKFKNALTNLCNLHNIPCYPLHGQLSLEEQNLSLIPTPHRKIILATNVAETSLTVENLGFVIDFGLVKTSRIDFDYGLPRLDLEKISKFSAEQRAGRSGRVSSGTCYRLWTRDEQTQLNQQSEAEIHRSDLSSALLQIYVNGSDEKKFPWFETPRHEIIQHSLDKLTNLKAIKNGSPTPLAGQLIKHPLEPRLAYLLESTKNKSEKSLAALVCALLSEGDFIKHASFQNPTNTLPYAQRFHNESDLQHRIECFKNPQKENIHFARLERVKTEFKRLGGLIENLNEWNENFDLLLLEAFSDRLCRLREQSNSDAVMNGKRGVQLAKQSHCWGAPFFVSLLANHPVKTSKSSMNSQGNSLSVTLAHPIDFQKLQKLRPEMIEKKRVFEFDANEGKLRVSSQDYFFSVPIGNKIPSKATEKELQDFYAKHIEDNFLSIINSHSELQSLHNRVEMLISHFDENSLNQFTLENWKQTTIERVSFTNSTLLQNAEDLATLFKQSIPYNIVALLEKNLPERIEVPSGNRYKIEYSLKSPPKLSVRLQEIFGWNESPKILNNTTPLLIELLSPGFKPVQTTHDLASFWKNTYFEVRKELRARYPKHSWPEDPLTAKAVAKGKARHQT